MIKSYKDMTELEKERRDAHLKAEAEKARRAAKKEAARIKNKAKLKKWLEKYRKKHPKPPEVPSIILNSRKVGNKASNWFKKIPLSEITEEDIENETALGFER